MKNCQFCGPPCYLTADGVLFFFFFFCFFICIGGEGFYPTIIPGKRSNATVRVMPYTGTVVGVVPCRGVALLFPEPHQHMRNSMISPETEPERASSRNLTSVSMR